MAGFANELIKVAQEPAKEIAERTLLRELVPDAFGGPPPNHRMAKIKAKPREESRALTKVKSDPQWRREITSLGRLVSDKEKRQNDKKIQSTPEWKKRQSIWGSQYASIGSQQGKEQRIRNLTTDEKKRREFAENKRSGKIPSLPHEQPAFPRTK